MAKPPYADDPLLRDTFEKQRPLLSADAGLSKLTRYLSLTKLDDAVTTSALPFGEDHGEVYDTVRERINGIKPYLFALVRADNSSAENRVRPALRNLELVVCQQLVLHYEYEGTQVSREDAVCYIASRPEKRSRRTVNVGTAYLEVDPTTNEPHWFPLGRQLAQYLNVPTLADAFTMLLTASPEDRKRMMADRQIQPHDIDEARQLLRLAQEDEGELSNVLDSLIPEAVDKGEDEASDAAASTKGSVGGTSTQSPESNDDISEESGDETDKRLKESSKRVPMTPPPVDFSSVEIVDGVSDAPSESEPSKRNGHYIGGGRGASKTLHVQTDEENRRIGKRGEEVAYHAERGRLKDLGKNPDSVHWISRVDESSPYDMMSVDGDDQLIYIEVKSTKSADPTDAFYISQAELIEATHRRSRFYIYRVTDVDTAIPSITRWADPLGLIKEGKGRLLLAKAQMALTLDEEADGGSA